MIQINNVRLSFENLYTPSNYQGGALNFSATFLIPKDDEATIASVEAHIAAVTKTKWEGKKVKLLQGCLHDGEEKDHLAGYEGCVYISSSTRKGIEEAGSEQPDGEVELANGKIFRYILSNRTRPKLYGRDGRMLPFRDDGTLYSGCWVNAQVNMWAQDNKFGKRINCELLGVQKLRDDERFGGGEILGDGAFEAVEGCEPMPELGEDKQPEIPGLSDNEKTVTDLPSTREL